jgi:hypothetical protein
MDVEGSGLYQHVWRDWGNPRKSSIRIAGLRAEI